TPETNSKIFPVPSDVRAQPGEFHLADDVSILVPREPPEEDLLLARALRDELADWFGLILNIERVSGLTQSKRAIVLGMRDRPLVQAWLERAGVGTSVDPSAGAESYTLHVRPRVAVVSGSDLRGVSHGFQSLRQLLTSGSNGPSLPCIDVRDSP